MILSLEIQYEFEKKIKKNILPNVKPQSDCLNSRLTTHD